MFTNLSDRWVLASNNQGKLKEFKRLFAEAGLPAQVIPQGELGIDDAIEDGLSFIENALIKARHASRTSGLPAIADDSGLCVPILDGKPGIYSARYAGEHGNSVKNNTKLLADLEPFRRDGTPIIGQFICVLAMVRTADDPLPLITHGIWQGEILAEPRGEGGFGYDPIFWLPELGKSASELKPEEKASLSHRGQAMQKLIGQLTD